MKILVSKFGNYYLGDNSQFNTIGKLLKYYEDHDVPNAQQVKHLRLHYPITELIDGKKGKPPYRRGQSLPSEVVERPGLPGRNARSHKESTDASRWRQQRIVDENQTIDPHSRPPEPLPHRPAPTYISHWYSRVPDLEVDRCAEVIHNIRTQENMQKCTCGLYLSEAKLPDGWEIHRSDEPATKGLLFFMGPDKCTRWELPASIEAKLSPQHLQTIHRLEAG